MARVSHPRILGSVALGVLGCALLIALGSGSGPASAGSVKYKGKVGTAARLSFKVSGNKVKALKSGVQASCQRSSDGTITQIVVLVVHPKGKLKINKKGKFKGKGMEKDTGVRWSIKGKLKGSKKAKGSFEASQFRFNPFTLDGELCAGSGKWKAKRR